MAIRRFIFSLAVMGLAIVPVVTDGADAPTSAEPDKPETAPKQASMEPPPLLSLRPGELQVLQQLAKRRRALDAREARLVERERLALALEERLDAKADELRILQAALAEERQKLNAAGEDRAAADVERVRELAQAYKKMKPKDAARLFDGLEPSLLTAIARELSPRILAPIMARMRQDKAEALTAALRRE